jgi:hypothetical protein
MSMDGQEGNTQAINTILGQARHKYSGYYQQLILFSPICFTYLGFILHQGK